MTSSLTTALTLLVIGMITVFTILFLVVITGNILIRIVNRFFPIIAKNNLSNSSEASKIAVITAAVEAVTKGKGKIISIDKKGS
jgi:oxaloacetate decarboxylase gamma subunit